MIATHSLHDNWGAEHATYCPMCGVSQDEARRQHERNHPESAVLRLIANRFRDDPIGWAAVLLRCSDRGDRLSLREMAGIISGFMTYWDNRTRKRANGVSHASIQQHLESIADDLFPNARAKHILLPRGADHVNRRRITA